MKRDWKAFALNELRFMTTPRPGDGINAAVFVIFTVLAVIVTMVVDWWAPVVIWTFNSLLAASLTGLLFGRWRAGRGNHEA